MKKSNLLVLSLIFLVAFALIALNINSPEIKSLDNSINQYSANHQIPFIQSITIFVGTIFDPIYMIIFILVFSAILWFSKKKSDSILLFLTSGISGVLIFILKQIFERARPANSIITDIGSSFPSGHALISVVLFGILIYFSLKIKSQARKNVSIAACVLGILLVGLGRVYLNIHWFSDVIAGYCFGLFLVLGVFYLYRVIRN